MKVLAIDFGSKRIGLAVGNSQTRVGTPLGQIASSNQRLVLDEIARKIGEFEIEQIVVGYPLNMDGSRGPACMAVERFAASLRKRAKLPVVLVDEKLSSFEAEEMGKAIEGDFRKRKTFLDSVAAQVILKTFFERS
ncbi:MAG: Holliday junction resolvase RuvX [Candidatus Aminicenantes bacterium]|nr:Holliday junction resolvase RuvX [Candidatus Aminicenantes bacterium]